MIDKCFVFYDVIMLDITILENNLLFRFKLKYIYYIINI